MYHWTHSFVQPLSLSFLNPDWLCSLFPEVQHSQVLTFFLIMFNPRRTSLLKFWWWHVVTSSLCFMTLTSCFTAFRLMRMVRIGSKCPRSRSFDVPGSCDWFFDSVFGWFTTSMRCRPSESWPKFTCKGSSLPAAHLEMRLWHPSQKQLWVAGNSPPKHLVQRPIPILWRWMGGCSFTVLPAVLCSQLDGGIVGLFVALSCRLRVSDHRIELSAWMART